MTRFSGRILAIFFSTHRPVVIGRIALELIVICSGVFMLLVDFEAFTPLQRILESDFFQFYLQGLALRRGLSPYLPIPELSQQLFGQASLGTNPHPSPYTPIAAMVFTPLSFVPVIQLRAIWMFFSAVLAATSFFLLGRSSVKFFAGIRHCFFFTALMILSVPGAQDLFYGQWNFVIFFLAVSTYCLLRREREFYAGLVFGFAFAIKLFGWPVILVALATKRFNFVVGAALSCCVSAAIYLAVLPSQYFAEWFLRAGPAVSQMWGFVHNNFSALTLISRLTDPNTISFSDGRAVLDFHSGDSRNLLFFSWMFGFALVCGTVLILLRRLRYSKLEFMDIFPALIMLSTVSNPVAWQHYFLVAFLPVALAVNSLYSSAHTKKQEKISAASVLSLIALLFLDFNSLATYSVTPYGDGISIAVWARLILLVPTLLCLLPSLTSPSYLAENESSFRQANC